MIDKELRELLVLDGAKIYDVTSLTSDECRRVLRAARRVDGPLCNLAVSEWSERSDQVERFCELYRRKNGLAFSLGEVAASWRTATLGGELCTRIVDRVLKAADLTEFERIVCRQMLAGYTLSQMAEEAGSSRGRVKRKYDRVLAYFKVGRRIDLVNVFFHVEPASADASRAASEADVVWDEQHRFGPGRMVGEVVRFLKDVSNGRGIRVKSGTEALCIGRRDVGSPTDTLNIKLSNGQVVRQVPRLAVERVEENHGQLHDDESQRDRASVAAGS